MKSIFKQKKFTSSLETSSKGIKIYPNPTTGKINILGVEIGTQIRVYNSMGQIVLDKNLNKQPEIISFGKLPSGVYLIHIRDKHKILESCKIVKR